MANKAGDSKEEAQCIHTAGMSLLELINDTVSLAEYGHISKDLSIGKVKVREALKEVINRVQTTELDIPFSAPQSLHHISSDREKLQTSLQKILRTLCEVDSTKKINISAERNIVEGRPQIDIIISDKDRILNEFQRANILSPFSADCEYRTIGFAVASIYAQSLNGSLQIEDKPHLSLKLSFPCLTSIANRSKSNNSSSTEDKIVVVISSEQRIAELLAAILNNEGKTVHISRNLEQLRHLSSNYQLEAIVLDISNATAQDWKTVSQLKRDSKLRKIPIILEPVLDDGNMGCYVGPTGYLIKPITKEKLSKSLERNLPDGVYAKHVLLVEDQISEQEMEARMIEELGCTVVVKSSAEEALDALQNDTFDLIVIDLILKEIDGFELLQNIREERQYDHIPVVVATAMILTAEERSKVNREAVKVTDVAKQNLIDLLPSSSTGNKSMSHPPNLLTKNKYKGNKQDWLKGVRVLIVDDIESNRSLLKRNLVELGCHTMEAASGEEAIKMVSSYEVDIILLDIIMPRMNGVEALKVLRSQFNESELPIIMVTSKDEPSDVADCLELGANDYVTKPIDMTVLMARLATQVKLSRSAGVIAKAYRHIKSDISGVAVVQRSLLPEKKPTLENLDVTWRFTSCDDLAGDIFNVVQLDDNHVGLYMIDVSGHGVQAALMSSTLSHFLKNCDPSHSMIWDNTNGSPTPASPEQVVSKLNLMFPLNTETCQYFTMHYGILNVNTGFYRSVTAGCPAPIVIRDNGEVWSCKEKNPAVGLLADSQYKQSEVYLSEGDRLCILSDGYQEARNESDIPLGSSKLTEKLVNGKSKSIDDALHSIEEYVFEWNNGCLEDDLTAIGIDFKKS